tara:strand:- start:635 stop:952 length:318 start_codon:yes stop_codon:yes gene_type:complete
MFQEIEDTIKSFSPTILDNFLINNKFIIYPILFSMQMVFGGLGVVLVPKKIKDLSNSPITRLLLLILVAFVATRNLALALVGALSFSLLLYLLRNDSEKDAVGIF